MLHGGLDVVLRNQNHQRPDLKLFEFGYTYHKEKSGHKENPCLAIFISGRKEQEGWVASNDQVDFYYLKGIVNSIISRLGIGKAGITTEIKRSDDWSGQSWKILNKEVGFVGEVDDALLKKRGIKKSVYYACINWFEVAELLATNNIKYQELPKYPEVRRDLALLLDDSVEFKEVEAIAKKSGKKLLKSITLFDVYQGNNIPEGKMSYAVGFVFRDNERTLEDADIDGVMKELIEGFEKKLKAEIR
jgi:phenylalanyl-tRNA synthetase beta chain